MPTDATAVPPAPPSETHSAREVHTQEVHAQEVHAQEVHTVQKVRTAREVSSAHEARVPSLPLSRVSAECCVSDADCSQDGAQCGAQCGAQDGAQGGAQCGAQGGALDGEALLDGAWTTLHHPCRTSSVEPWPRPTVHVGASILCFAVDPTHGRVYFWLGKERKVLTWGAGFQRWSDFGGGSAPSDMDAAETAAREFMQETAGCVRYFETDTTSVRTTFADIAASLRRGEYLFRLETAIPETADARADATRPIFVTYVVQVPWDPRAIMRFQHCRAMLSGLHKRLLRVSLSAAEEEALRPANVQLRASRERWLLHHPAVRKRTRLVPSYMMTGSARPDTLHGCEVERAPVVDTVSLDFIEKECIDLWSIPQLERALQYDGILSNRDGSVESLRPSFIAVLMEAFDEFKIMYPHHF